MAGKTKIGHELADVTGYKFIDTDELIVKAENREISDIFDIYGEKYFRDMEAKTAEGLAETENSVISTGGGLVLRKENIDNLRKNGVIVNLRITPEVIKNRIESERATRPVIKNSDIDETLNKLAEREEFYADCDYYIVVSDERSPREHAEMIIELLKRNGEM